MSWWSGAEDRHRSGYTGSLRRVTPVHRQGNARDVVRSAAGEEDCGPGEFVWLPPAPMRNTCGDRVIPLWRGGGRQACVNPSWEDCIDLNIVFGPEHRQALGELHHPSLGRRVGWGDTAAEDRRHRADVNNFAPARLEHMRIHRTCTQENPGEVGVQHVLPLFQGVILRRLADVDPRVIDQNIDALKCLYSGLNHG